MKKNIECIFGAAGSGKSHKITESILASLKNGKRVFLIVPEQEVMIAERRIADAADAAIPPISCEDLNVVSFRRLANLAFRKYGGISYSGPSDGARSVIMWQVTEELAPLFKEYTGARDRSFPELMLTACDEAKRSGITPQKLEAAASKLPSDSALGRKLSDLALVYSGYSAMLSGNYTDPKDDVARLGELLKKHRFFEGSAVYMDSFNGFTEAEYTVITHAINQADRVTVALCLPQPIPTCGFETVRKTVERLRRICDRMEIAEEDRSSMFIERSCEYYPDVFIKLERAIRYQGTEIADGDLPTDKELASFSTDPTIQLVRPTDEFSEAEYAATRILELVEKGARYRDIAIVGRGTDRFSGILDSALTSFGIPYFMSVRRPISTTPLFRIILRALSAIDGGWRHEEIVAYLKTGMTDLTVDEISELEEYATLWNISGRLWTSDDEWTMNPDGYTDKLSQEGAERLDRVNALRTRVIAPLSRFSEEISATDTKPTSLRDGCAAIYSFLNELGIAERIRKGNSDEDATLYNTLMDMLDMLVHVGGDIPINARVLCGILTMAADKTDYGALPQTADTVTVGDAALLRAGSVKHVIMLGCTDGVFPRAVADDSFFSDTEKQALSELGLDTLQRTEDMSDDELFYFYRAATAASVTLSASCPMQGGDGTEHLPSSGFNRLEAFIKKWGSKVLSYPTDLPIEKRAYSTANAAELYREYEDSSRSEAIRQALIRVGMPDAVNGDLCISEPNAQVTAETAAKLFGGDIALTQSRLESFSNCPFKYYSSYALKLSTVKKAEFSSADIGNFIHRVLECVVAELFDDNGLKQDKAEKANIDELLQRTVADVVRGILGANAVLPARTAALISRLQRTAELLVRALIEEFKGSAFVPRFFEMDIGGKNGVPPFSVPLSDGSHIYVYGKIDRVDTYKKGNDIYVRIVDYKTGTRKHSLKKIEKGLDLQMLLYLFAIWKADRRSLPETLCPKDASGSIIPAGVIYQDASYPTVRSDAPPESTDEALNAGLKMLKRSGLLLNDEGVLIAMGSENGNHLPISKNKEGVYRAASDSMLCDLEEIGELADKVSDILAEIGGRMRSGKASASPRVSEKPCEYCDFRSFCRSAKT